MNFDTVPSWAYNACYYIIALFGIAVLMAIVQIMMFFSASKSKSMAVLMSLGVLIGLAVTGFVYLMNFWICRSALKA